MISVCNFIAKIEIPIRWKMPTGTHLLQLSKKYLKYKTFDIILRQEVQKFKT